MVSLSRSLQRSMRSKGGNENDLGTRRLPKTGRNSSRRGAMLSRPRIDVQLSLMTEGPRKHACLAEPSFFLGLRDRTSAGRHAFAAHDVVSEGYGRKRAARAWHSARLGNGQKEQDHAAGSVSPGLSPFPSMPR